MEMQEKKKIVKIKKFAYLGIYFRKMVLKRCILEKGLGGWQW